MMSFLERAVYNQAIDAKKVVFFLTAKREAQY